MLVWRDGGLTVPQRPRSARSATTGTGVSTVATPGSTSMIVGDKPKSSTRRPYRIWRPKPRLLPATSRRFLTWPWPTTISIASRTPPPLYEQMLKLGEDPMLRNNYGNMLRDLGKTEEAKAAYRKALEEDPKLVVAYVNLAALLATEGKKDEAYRSSTRASPSSKERTRHGWRSVKTALQKAK